MTEAILHEIVRNLLNRHPNVSPSPRGHVAHAERYLTTTGAPIAFEPERIRVQNIWVRADAVSLIDVADVQHDIYEHANFKISKPNHDLFGEPAFKNADLICFKPRTAWEAVRVVAAVEGAGLAK